MSKAVTFLSSMSEGKWDGHLKGIKLNAGAKRLLQIEGDFIVSAVPMKEIKSVSFAFKDIVKMLTNNAVKAIADGEGRIFFKGRIEVVFPCEFKED